MSRRTTEVPRAHVDDEPATEGLTDALANVHGEPYGFAVRRWDGPMVLESDEDRVTYHVVVDADDASTTVRPGDPVRGPPPEAAYREPVAGFPTARKAHTAAIRPGDVIVLQPDEAPVELTGAGATFEVRAPATAYPAPRFGFLRNVPDDPAGCAEYEQAFRREVLPPKVSAEADDTRGVNRVNQHTIDMRHDREPTPVQHCHAPVATGDGPVPHTETAVVLDRSTYGLPPVEESDNHIRFFRRPHEDPTDWVDVPVEPGSIVVTPATGERVYGHCFRNAFAVLVAVPGFTAPLIELGADADREGESHRKYHE
jgi:hypothetical protein